jgi:hypothetical protein
MAFDPLINYGVLDFSKEENLVYWNFSELIKTLITFSKDAGDQLEIMGTNAAATEMALDFDSFYTLSATKYSKYKLLDFEEMNEIAGIGLFLDERSDEEVFWTADSLYSNRDWAWVRLKARELLKMIGMDHLDIQVEKERKTVENVGGIKESAQVIQRILIHK